MKKQLLLTGLFTLMMFFGFAQKYAYINSEYLLSQIPEYKEAQAELDRVINAVNDYAKERGYAFVFDTAGDLTIIYADPKWDINEQVLQKMGISASRDDD